MNFPMPVFLMIRHGSRLSGFTRERKKERHLLDFDDLLLRTAERIENGRVNDGWEKKFRYLMVDEFQDINPSQLKLVKLWSCAGRELFVIGDPNQSIYGFRGADSACFERLKKEYDDLEVVNLKEKLPLYTPDPEGVIGGDRRDRIRRRGNRRNAPSELPGRRAREDRPHREPYGRGNIYRKGDQPDGGRHGDARGPSDSVAASGQKSPEL